MANLDAMADKAVRDAVDAFMEGRLPPPYTGASAFETRHSRYRLRDSIIVEAPDDSLVGAELVGWLMERPEWSSVEPMWQPGARAVLVDRTHGRNIIVTSTTRILQPDAPRMSPVPEPPPAPVIHVRPPPIPPLSPRSAPILPSTPPPPYAVATPPPPVPAPSAPSRPHAPAPPRPLTQSPSPSRPLAQAPAPSRPVAQPPAPSRPLAQSPSPSRPLAQAPVPSRSGIQGAAVVQRPPGAIHMPPRPIQSSPGQSSPGQSSPGQPSASELRESLGLARPLPAPAPVPLPRAPLPQVAPQVNAPPPPPEEPPWEVTSAELEVASVPLDDDAAHRAEASVDGPESSRDAPIPLVRPIDPHDPAGRSRR